VFAEDFCKILAINGSYAHWGGIDFVFERINETKVNISFSTSSGIPQSLCAVDSKNEKLAITIAQTADGIAIATGNGECGKTSETVNRGFFAFVGETNGDDIGKQELLSFVPTASDYTQESVSYDNHYNRKLFKGLVGRKSPKKRRYVVAGNVTPGDVLTAKDDGEMTKENTKVIFEILSEITERAKLALDLEILKSLLELIGSLHVLRAEKTLTDRIGQTRETHRSLTELKLFMNDSLSAMSNVVSAEASTTDERLVKTLEQLLQLETEAQVLTAYSKEEHQRWFSWNVVLGAICIFEFVDYVVFFFIRRHQTRDFKID
jgi:hypothetical protein